ncbi:MAG: type II toxin-antitoxin system Phd/YefM family antitoxin [Thermoanaerobaculia bacterium]
MDTMAISRFKATCLAALENVRKTGKPLLVTRRGVPVAQVLPPPPERSGHGGFGSMRARAKELADIVEPVASDDWEVLG